MVEQWFRSKPKSASAERCLRSLGAMKPIAASEMELSNRSIVCVTGVLSHCGLRKANGKMGVVTGIRSLPGIAGFRARISAGVSCRGKSGLMFRCTHAWLCAMEVIHACKACNSAVGFHQDE